MDGRRRKIKGNGGNSNPYVINDDDDPHHPTAADQLVDFLTNK